MPFLIRVRGMGLRHGPLILVPRNAVPDQLRGGADRQVILLGFPVTFHVVGGADGSRQDRRTNRHGQQNEQEGHQDRSAAVVF